MNWAKPVFSALLLPFSLTSPALAEGDTRQQDIPAVQEDGSAPEPALPPKPSRPAYQNIRLEEDWSMLEEADRHGWDSLKNIPLTAGGAIRATLGGQLRLRGEYWNNFNFGEAPEGDAFGLFRLRLHGDVSLGPNLRVFVEGISALANGRELPGGNRIIDTDSADFQSALVEVRSDPGEKYSLAFRAGRQELQYGRQRLVSPLDWVNARRTFDGFKAVVGLPGWSLDAFWSRLAPARKYRLNTHDSGQDLFGVYATTDAAGPVQRLDLYWLGLERERAAFSAATGSEKRHTFGALAQLAGPRTSSLEVEAAYQTGDFAGQRIAAFMATVQGSYGWPSLPAAPQALVALDYASGDGDGADGKLKTFNQLYPLGHAFLGLADFVGRQNIIDFRQEASLKAARWLSLAAANHFFWRASTADALYNAGGGVVRAGRLGDGRFVGTELDLTFKATLDRHAAVRGGYSRFFAGSFIRQSGPAEDIDFFQLAVEYTF